MLNTLLLDLGDTLVKDDQVLPFVQESLTALRSFQIADGSSLSTSLVSDYFLAKPLTPQVTNEIFNDYLQLLADFGLAEFFEPSQEKVTLSTHANVFKPNQQLFDLALLRLGGLRHLDSCLFITENEDHIAACRGFGMETLTFGVSDPEEGFDDWSAGIMLIANRFTVYDAPNIEAAFPVWAKAHLKCDHIRVVDVTPTGQLTAIGHCWVPIRGTADSGMDGVNVQLPVAITAGLDEFGLPKDIELNDLDQEMLTEARAFVDSLTMRDQISVSPAKTTPQQTHFVEQDDAGTRFLKRRGFN